VARLGSRFGRHSDGSPESGKLSAKSNVVNYPALTSYLHG